MTREAMESMQQASVAAPPAAAAVAGPPTAASVASPPAAAEPVPAVVLEAEEVPTARPAE
jgi:hypothetical protein